MDHLVLDNQLLCSSLGETIHLIPSIPQLLGILCVELGSCELSLVLLAMFIGVILVSYQLFKRKSFDAIETNKEKCFVW